MTNKIAPHRGREVQMVLSGEKPFAVIEAKKDPQQFREAFAFGDKLDVRSTGVYEISIERRGTGSRNHYEYMKLLRDRKQIVRKIGGLEEYQRRMGRLFGYSDEEIQEFIKNNPDCTCGKCGGNE